MAPPSPRTEECVYSTYTHVKLYTVTCTHAEAGEDAGCLPLSVSASPLEDRVATKLEARHFSCAGWLVGWLLSTQDLPVSAPSALGCTAMPDCSHGCLGFELMQAQQVLLPTEPLPQTPTF